MKVYQVLNSLNNPAGCDLNPLAIFKTKKQAQKYIKYLVQDCCLLDDFTIITKSLI